MIVIQQRYKLQSINEGFREALVPMQRAGVPPWTTARPRIDRAVIVMAAKAMICGPATTAKKNRRSEPLKLIISLVDYTRSRLQ
jgi:hypothetical protein